MLPSISTGAPSPDASANLFVTSYRRLVSSLSGVVGPCNENEERTSSHLLAPANAHGPASGGPSSLTSSFFSSSPFFSSCFHRYSLSTPLRPIAVSHSLSFPHSQTPPSSAHLYVILHLSSLNLTFPSSSLSVFLDLIACVQWSLASPFIRIIPLGGRSTSTFSPVAPSWRNCIFTGLPSERA